MMLSLEAIGLTPELHDVPRDQIVIIGSVAIALYKDMVGMPAREHHLHIDDLDLSMPRPVYTMLDGQAKDKSELLSEEQNKDKSELLQDENPWLRNGYRGVHTVRRNVAVPGLRRLVQLDIGTGAHTWSHEELLGSDLTYSGYRVIDPRQQLTWYEALNRKKDQAKIELLSTIIIPALDSLIVRGDSE